MGPRSFPIHFAAHLAVLAGGMAVQTAAAADRAAEWSAETAAGLLTASIDTRGKGQAMIIELRTAEGMRINPPVLRIDMPALVRDSVKGRFPMTVRGTAGKPPRAVLSLTGPLRFAEPDSNDGMARVEFRYCPPEPARCGVERVDIPVRAGRR